MQIEIRRNEYRLLQDVYVDLTHACPVSTQEEDLHMRQLLLRYDYRWDGASGVAVDTVSSLLPSAVHDKLYEICSKLPPIQQEAFRKWADEEYRILLINARTPDKPLGKLTKAARWVRAWYHYLVLRMVGHKYV